MRLFKYRACDQRSRDILVSHRIYFASVWELNDPYEGKIVPKIGSGDDIYEALIDMIDEGISEGVIDQRLRDALIGQYEGTNREIAAALLTDIESKKTTLGAILSGEESPSMLRLFKKMGQDAINGAFQEFHSRTSICTFSECGDIQLMYAHYANGHRGFCLEIETDSIKFEDHNGVAIVLEQVDYLDDVPEIEFPLKKIKDKNEMLKLIRPTVFSKSSEWKYEREWRMLRHAPSGLHQLPVSAITGITYGAKIPNAEFQSLHRLVEGRGIEERKAILRDGAFGLEILPLEA
jgi:hypothetical protein